MLNELESVNSSGLSDSASTVSENVNAISPESKSKVYERIIGSVVSLVSVSTAATGSEGCTGLSGMLFISEMTLDVN